MVVVVVGLDLATVELVELEPPLPVVPVVPVVPAVPVVVVVVVVFEPSNVLGEWCMSVATAPAITTKTAVATTILRERDP